MNLHDQNRDSGPSEPSQGTSDDSPKPWATTEEQSVFENSFLTLHSVRRISPRTNIAGDFLVIRSADWMVVIPFTETGDLILVEQYRHGSDEISLEFPAGLIDRGEQPAKCAARELREETGFSAGKIMALGSFRPNPALQHNRCFVFAAVGCVASGSQQLDSQEDIVVRTLSPRQVLEKIQSGQLNHAASLTALTKLWLADDLDHSEELLRRFAGRQF